MSPTFCMRMPYPSSQGVLHRTVNRSNCKHWLLARGKIPPAAPMHPGMSYQGPGLDEASFGSTERTAPGLVALDCVLSRVLWHLRNHALHCATMLSAVQPLSPCSCGAHDC